MANFMLSDKHCRRTMKEIPFQANGPEFCKMSQIGVEARKEIFYTYDEIRCLEINNYATEIACFICIRSII